jgi:hypothetical protein
MMVPAGRLQDKFGPRIVATIGAILTGLGLIVAGFDRGVPVFGFGVWRARALKPVRLSARSRQMVPPAKKGDHWHCREWVWPLYSCARQISISKYESIAHDFKGGLCHFDRDRLQFIGTETLW